MEVATRWKSPEGHYTAVGPAASLEVPETLPRSQALSLNWAGGDLPGVYPGGEKKGRASHKWGSGHGCRVR